MRGLGAVLGVLSPGIIALFIVLAVIGAHTRGAVVTPAVPQWTVIEPNGGCSVAHGTVTASVFNPATVPQQAGTVTVLLTRGSAVLGTQVIRVPAMVQSAATVTGRAHAHGSPDGCQITGVHGLPVIIRDGGNSQ